jgi:hypothetical protein
MPFAREAVSPLVGCRVKFAPASAAMDSSQPGDFAASRAAGECLDLENFAKNWKRIG